MRLRAAAALITVLIAGCPKSDTPPTAGDTDAVRSLAEAHLPADWSGEGVLARLSGSTPSSAPQWTRVAAEVISRDGDRLLRACGRAGRIRNPALARTTAESRARSELSRWLRTHEVKSSRAVDTWTEPGTGLPFALLEVVVPEEWVPGQPLP